jgi:hypothetical protein
MIEKKISLSFSGKSGCIKISSINNGFRVSIVPQQHNDAVHLSKKELLEFSDELYDFIMLCNEGD